MSCVGQWQQRRRSQGCCRLRRLHQPCSLSSTRCFPPACVGYRIAARSAFRVTGDGGHGRKVPEPSGRAGFQIQEGLHANEARGQIQLHVAQAYPRCSRSERGMGDQVLEPASDSGAESERRVGTTPIRVMDLPCSDSRCLGHRRDFVGWDGHSTQSGA